MKQYSLSAIQQWSRFYRANFINSLSGFKSVSLIGSIDSAGRHNLAVFSNIVHIGADPALIGFINRPREAAPHTIGNIEEVKEYTINLVPSTLIQQAHHSSAKYEKGISEFEMTGLTPAFHPCSKAPFVEESPVKYAMQLEKIIPIELNGTWLVIGSVQEVILENEAIVETDGFIRLDKNNITCSLGIDGYYQPALLARFPYAKPVSGR